MKNVLNLKIVSFNKLLLNALFTLCKKRKCTIGNQNKTVSNIRKKLEQRASNAIVYYQIDLFRTYSCKSSNSR